jgi:DeoR/GlpR family transcriptional regulator of sugar metabolism
LSLPKPERQGRLARTYGGAMALGAHPEASLRHRTGEALEQKHAIARWAAAVIRPGENILLDAGSTVGALAHELRGFEKLSVTTRASTPCRNWPIPRASRWTAWAGRLRSLSQSFVGPLAAAALERMTLTGCSWAQTQLKELMARRGRDVYVLLTCPSSACGRSTLGPV